MTGKGRRSGEIPWLLVATVAGIIIVIIVALMFFSGGGSPAGTSSAGPSSASAPSAASTTASSASVSARQTAGPAVTLAYATDTPVAIPTSGVYIRVDYIGGFTGSYGMNDSVLTAQDSGTKFFEVGNATGTVTAVFKKDDGSKHTMTVAIVKDGTSVKSAETSDAYGNVSVSADI